MSQPKGAPKTGGRKPGTPNKATADVRQAIALIVARNIGSFQGWCVVDAVAGHRSFQGWLDKIAAKDPAKAADIFVRIIEYHIPKLARTDVTTNGKELPRSVAINVIGR